MEPVQGTPITAFDPGARSPARAALRISLFDAALSALMVGVAECYLDAFAVELGHGPRALGLLATLPVLAGVSCLLLAPLARVWFGSRKRLCIAGALGQAVSLTALIGIATHQSSSFAALLCAKLGLGISLGLTEPAWRSWMAELTLNVDRSRYFARRSTVFHGALLIGFGAAGWALQRAGSRPFDCYAALFVVALLARLASAVALALQAELEGAAPPTNVRSLVPRLRGSLARGKYQVTLYLACLGLGAEIAAPFFTSYMLRELSLEYRSYAGLAALSMLAKVAAFLSCHSLAARLGLRRLLRWGGIGAALVPLLWAASSDPSTLILANVLTGGTWALVEFASYQLLFDDAPLDLTVEFFALSSAMVGLAQVVGALCGGVLLDAHRLDFQSVFVLSALLSAAPLALLSLTLGAGKRSGEPLRGSLDRGRLPDSEDHACARGSK